MKKNHPIVLNRNGSVCFKNTNFPHPPIKTIGDARNFDKSSQMFRQNFSGYNATSIRRISVQYRVFLFTKISLKEISSLVEKLYSGKKNNQETLDKIGQILNTSQK